MKTIGTWTKLDDGTWGGQWRTGGRAGDFIGCVGRIRATDGKMAAVRLISVAKDYGFGDVAIYVVAGLYGISAHDHEK